MSEIDSTQVEQEALVAEWLRATPGFFERHAELYQDDEHVTIARPKLTKLLKDSFAPDESSQGGCSHQTQNHPQQQYNTGRIESPCSVTGSITGMKIQDQDMKTDESSITSRLSQLSGRSCHSMSISLDSNISVSLPRGSHKQNSSCDITLLTLSPDATYQ